MSEKVEMAEVEVKGFELLGQVAGKFAPWNPESPDMLKDPGIVELVKKSREYLNLLFDRELKKIKDGKDE